MTGRPLRLHDPAAVAWSTRSDMTCRISGRNRNDVKEYMDQSFQHSLMTAEAIRPPEMTTVAWMSPWRDVPQPV